MSDHHSTQEVEQQTTKDNAEGEEVDTNGGLSYPIFLVIGLALGSGIGGALIGGAIGVAIGLVVGGGIGMALQSLIASRRSK